MSCGCPPSAEEGADVVHTWELTFTLALIQQELLEFDCAGPFQDHLGNQLERCVTETCFLLQLKETADQELQSLEW